jgi:hypothetical protein
MNHKKYATTEMAKTAAKKHFGACIFTGALYGAVDSGTEAIAGAHIHPAGVYRSISRYRQNIVPIVFSKHTLGNDTLDWVEYGKVERDDFEKVIFIYDNIEGEFRSKFTIQMFELIEILEHEKLNLAAQNLNRLMETYI